MLPIQVVKWNVKNLNAENMIQNMLHILEDLCDQLFDQLETSHCVVTGKLTLLEMHI
jgi:hypothetical protein